MRRSVVLMISIQVCNYTVFSAPLVPLASPINTTSTLPSCHSCLSWDPRLSWSPCSWDPCLRPCPPPPDIPDPRPLPGVPDPQVFPVLPVSPFEQSINSRASVQVLYYWVSENLLETIGVASVVTVFIVLALKVDTLSSLTQSDLPADPSLYKAYLCLVFRIEIAEVIDLTGRIDRLRLIAEGGCGKVYEGAWIVKLNENPLISTPEALPRVVVKLIKMPPLQDKVPKDKRYTRELELWSKLNHPHILPLIGIARIANLPAFISPRMENGNVMEFLKQNPSFPSFRFLKDIIKGLHYLHTFEPVIVHSDIKGANVLVNHRNEACLSDFGLSFFALDNRVTDTHANGTLRWMAPELIQGTVLTSTTASDIYAFAMTCYEILARKTPFAGTNDTAVIHQVLDGQRPERINPYHSDTIWSIITRCWAQKPEDRPSTEETSSLILKLDVEVSVMTRLKDLVVFALFGSFHFASALI